MDKVINIAGHEHKTNIIIPGKPIRWRYYIVDRMFKEADMPGSPICRYLIIDNNNLNIEYIIKKIVKNPA